MTDEDLAAVCAHLTTLKPVSHRVDHAQTATLCPWEGSMHGGAKQDEGK